MWMGDAGCTVYCSIKFRWRKSILLILWQIAQNVFDCSIVKTANFYHILFVWFLHENATSVNSPSVARLRFPPTSCRKIADFFRENMKKFGSFPRVTIAIRFVQSAKYHLNMLFRPRISRKERGVSCLSYTNSVQWIESMENEEAGRMQ